MAQPIRTHTIQPKAREDHSAERPQEIRYGFCPFKDINLANGDGTIGYRVQPEGSPYERTILKNELIPFPTFTWVRREPSPYPADSSGRPQPLSETAETQVALESVVAIHQAYAGWGFTILNSLQGMEQSDAARIFTVIMPFDWKLGELISELQFNASARIESLSDLVYDDGYTIEALRSESERATARECLMEMLAGAETAFQKANDTLNDTEQSMTTAFSGGKGKKGADPNDIYLSNELGRELPRLIGKKDTSSEISDLAQSVKYLTDREATRETKEELDRLRREIDELKSAQAQPCGYPTGSGTPCKIPLKAGETYCSAHAKKALEVL